jgi:hypothetical protein
LPSARRDAGWACLAWTNILVLNLWNAAIFLITRPGFILAIMIGILRAVRSDRSINSTTTAFSVLLAFFGGHMVLVPTYVLVLHLIHVSQYFVLLFLAPYLKALSADRVSLFPQEPHGDSHSICVGCRGRASFNMKTSSWHDLKSDPILIWISLLDLCGLRRYSESSIWAIEVKELDLSL